MSSRLSKWLFIYVLLSTSYFFQGPSANVNSRFNLTLAISDDSTIQIDKYHRNTVDKSFYDNHYYSDKAPGLSFISALLLKITNPFFKILNLSLENDFLLKLYFVCLVFLSLLAAWTATRFYKFTIEIIGDNLLAFYLTVLCFTGTFIFAYSTIFMTHQIVGFLLFLCFYYLRNIPSLSRFQIHALAATMAFACILEYTTAPLFIFAYAYLNYKTFKQEKFYTLIPLVFVCILLAYYNNTAFGAPWRLGYNYIVNTEFSEMNNGFFGMNFLSPSALYGISFSEFRGLFYYNPIFIFSLFGINYLFKKTNRRYIFLSSLIPFCFLFFVNASYTYWTGGSCFGPRHLVPSLLLFFVPILFLPRNLLRSAFFWTVALVGYFYVIVATTVLLTPGDNIFSPFWGYIFPAFRGEISIKNYYSYNVGNFFNLSDGWSILPLFLFQLGSLLYVWLRFRRQENMAEQELLKVEKPIN